MSTLVVEAVQNAAGNKLEAVQLVSSGTSAGVASLDLDISSTVFTHWDLWIDSITPVTDGAVLAMRVSIDGGSTFKSGSTNFTTHTQVHGRNFVEHDVTVIKASPDTM